MTNLLHVGMGPLGRRMLKDFVQREQGRIVACVDIDPELRGKPLGEIEDGLPNDVRVTSSFEEIGDWSSIDAATVTTSSSLEACADTLRDLIDKGLRIVSSCEELLYPWLRHSDLANELHERCVAKSARLLGTGINPGFLMDTLPVVSTSVCTAVESVEIARVQDATTRRIPFQQKIGATLDLDAFEKKRQEGTLRHVGLLESLHFVAHYLGWRLDRWDETLEPVLATEDMSCGLGPIPKGSAAGVRQVGEGWIGDRCVLRLEFQAAIGQKDPHDRVAITGTPPVDLVIRGGVHGDIATSAVCLNSIGSLAQAQPGLHTMASIPPTPCRQPGA